MYATAEEPLEVEKESAEVCAVESKNLTECNNEAKEKRTVSLISAVRRRVATTPWKAELTRGTREGEPNILQRTGLHTFGEGGADQDGQEEVGTCYPKEAERDASFKAVPSGCVLVNIVIPQLPDEIVFYGSLELWLINGSKNGLSPSSISFVESGKLFSSEGVAGSMNELESANGLKLIGANAIELLTAK